MLGVGKSSQKGQGLKLTTTVIDTLANELADHGNLTFAAAAAGISKGTLWRWRSAGEKILEAEEEAEDLGRKPKQLSKYEQLLKELFLRTKKARSANGKKLIKTIHHADDVKGAMFLLERQYRQDFKPPVKEVEKKTEFNLNITAALADSRARLEAIKKGKK